MPKHKLPRKSTNIDMTAMCDVAFLLLSFFMLATKFKPSEDKPIKTPSSVSTKAIPTRDPFMVTIDNEGKVYVTLDEAKKIPTLQSLNRNRGLNLTESQITNLAKAPFYGVDHVELANLAANPKMRMKGLPVLDSANNQLYDYVYAALEANQGRQMTWILKGDQAAKYNVFKNVLDAFEKLNIHRFKIITAVEMAPAGTEVFKLRQNKNDKSQED
jgi:biopolymer transport protein ExbD